MDAITDKASESTGISNGKRRVQVLFGVVWKIDDSELYSMAADEIQRQSDEIESLRAQLMHAHSLISVMSAPIFEEAQP